MKTYKFVTACLFLLVLPIYGVLTHRYSFDESQGETILTDSIGGENAQIINSGCVQLGENDSVSLDGGRGKGYIDVPVSTLQGNDSMSIEVWATNNSHLSNSRIFEFGSSREERITWHWAGSRGTESYFQAVGLNENGSATRDIHELTPDVLDMGTEYHFTLTFEDIGSDLSVSIFLDSVLFHTSRLRNTDLADFQINHFSLGYDSFYGGSASASSYNELRIYDHALTQEQISQNFEYGSSVVPEAAHYGIFLGTAAIIFSHYRKVRRRVK
jgi:hypothetical protein